MTLEEKARELRREYKREWRKRNPERVKKYNDNYWINKAKNQKTPGNAKETTDER